MQTVQFVLGVYFLIINVLSFAFFGLDKMLAQGKSWRIPEKKLWFLAVIGGSVGALIGMNFFKHKTRKISFQFILALIILLQVGVLFLLSDFI